MNLGLEGTLVMGAMSALRRLLPDRFALAGRAGRRASLGVRLGRAARLALRRPRVNDVAVGIALMLFGVGLAFFLGKPLIGPTAPHLPAFSLGWWSELRPGAVGAAGERALRAGPRHHRGRPLPAAPHALGPHHAHGRRERRRRARHGLRRDARAPAGHDGGRLPGRRGRLVPVALLPGQLERRALQRAGADGGGAGDLRALGSRPLPLGLAAVRRAPARSARRCSRWG